MRRSERRRHLTHAEPWFVRNGLPWFVPREREQARRALRRQRTVPVLVLVAVSAAALGTALAWLTGRPSLAPGTLTLLVLLVTGVYAIAALGAGPIVTWAVRHTLAGVRELVPMVTRALPLLLLFVTFLFINAEVWQLSANLDGALLWLTVLLFAGIAVVFLLVRLPEEVDRVDEYLTASGVQRAVRGTPLQEDLHALLHRRGYQVSLESYRELSRMERANLVLVLLVTQAGQVLLLSLLVLGFFLLFGGLVMSPEVQTAWIAEDRVHALPYVGRLSVELGQVAVFLASFSGMYFAVVVITDDTYRQQFFRPVLAELQRAVGVRAAYHALADDLRWEGPDAAEGGG